MTFHRSSAPDLVTELRDLATIRRSADWVRWRDLTASAPPYLLPAFFALNAPLVDGTPVVATASRPEHLVGALPLVRAGGGFRAFRGEQTPRFDYWGAPEGLDAIWGRLRRDRDWSELLVEGVLAGSALATRLPALARADACTHRLFPAGRQRFLALPGFEDRLDARFRMGLRRCERKAGGVELERVLHPSRADFDEAIAIEAMAWKAAAGTDIRADPRVATMYRALGRVLAARGRSSTSFLRVGGRRIAVVLTIEDEHTLYALKTGYDPQYSPLGPGHLLFWKVASDAERRGLRTLEFLGRDAEWKRKWSDETHELVSVRVYQRSARAFVAYALREVVKPRLPEQMRDLRTPLRRGCQRADLVGRSSLLDRVRGRLDSGLGVKTGIRRLLAGPHETREPLGDPSRFAPGEWVRVLDEAALRATLDAASRLRGLQFIPQQWATCGRVLRVQKQVRRMRDDRGVYRPIARTVLLEGVSCAGDLSEPAGCGRRCPTMFRDEWLEPAARPRVEPGPSARLHARIRAADRIVGGLGLDGRRDGLSFMPEMAQYAGRRFPIVEKLRKVFELDRWVETRASIYVLEGLHCSGSVPGEGGPPCDRACALLWHEDWLIVERSTPSRASA